jgi:outer membrane protein OmpA-like peptidoglycan-associated protein/tetratricopeptide (TPR) repeat protein
MRYRNIIILVFIQLAFVFSITGQNVKKASRRALSYEYSEAVPVLEKIIEKNKKGKDEAIVLLADCYRLINNEAKAAEYYALAVGQEGIDPINHYYYGQALRTLGEYAKAKEQFSIYAGLVPDDSRGGIMAEYSDEIEGWLNMPAQHKAMNVASLNSPYSDFSPCFYRHGVVITTDRGVVNKSNETYEWTGKPYLGLDFARLNGVVTPIDLIYAEPALFSDDLNDNYHDGTVTFSPDGNTIYFTRTVQERVPKDEDRFSTYYLKIYSSNFDGENWSEPEEFFLNSDKYSVGHPALSPDGNCLFFASDMPDGQGGTDIYMCKNEGEGWSQAVNLGPTINTAFDEMFPFMDEEKTLYFASEGHLGYGGLDIFYTGKTDEDWMEPVNMKADVNSSYDDFGISTDINLGTGLFSSNRPGGIGLDDIYAFELAKKMLMICGKVVDPENNPLPGATVFFLNETRSEVLILKSDSTGTYCTEVEAETDYTILGKKTLYMDDCTLLAIDEDAVNPNDLVLTPYELDSAYKIENIYYDLDKYYIRPDAEPPLDELLEVMREHPINIELSSHTDCRASDAYNKELSQKRAESAVRYIVLQGIDPARMAAKGYGETMLVNECADGVQCTEEQHQLNRRTEFKIVSMDENAEDMLDNKYHAGDVISLREFDRDFFEECETVK